MKEEIDFLEYIYHIVKLERDFLARIIKMREDDILNKLLKEQILVYRRFSNSIEKMIETRKRRSTELSLLAKMASHVGAKVVLSNETDEIIDVLKKRYEICIEEVQSKLKENKIKSKTIINLSKRFIEFEHKNIELLNKKYLDQIS